MGTIVHLAEFFLISLALGVGIFSNIASVELTGAGFQKLVSSICLGASFLGAIVHLFQGHPLDAQALCFYVASISLLLQRLGHGDTKTLLMWALYGVQSISFLLLLYFFSAEDLSSYLFLLSSALFLGIVTYAMVLGHYYLVVPKLSERPLKICLLLLWALMAFKASWTTVGILTHLPFFDIGTQMGGGYAFNWLMLTMRVVWGYIIILAMSIFGWKLVCLRSIQSATGIFYAMTIFVFVGELISSFLFFEYGPFI